MMFCKILQNASSAYLSQNNLFINSDIYWNSCDQLTNNFDTVLQHDCLKAMTSPASQWHKHCFYQITQSGCHACEGKVQCKNGHFLLPAGLCEIWALATRSDSESPDAHHQATRSGVATVEDCRDHHTAWDTPLCLLSFPRNTSAAPGFPFPLGSWFNEEAVRCLAGWVPITTYGMVLSWGGQDAAVWWHWILHTPQTIIWCWVSSGAACKGC